MTLEQLERCPVEQREAFWDLVERCGEDPAKVLERAIAPTPLAPYIGVPGFAGMFVGIEPDGYTHT